MIEQKIIQTLEQKKSSEYAVKSSAFEGVIKDVDTGSRIVTGFYNTYNVFDDANDVLLMGAANKSIKECGPLSSAVAKIKHLMFHDMTLLPGKILTLEEKEINGLIGIYFETKMANTTLGNDVLLNYHEKVYDNHSIGFQYIDLEMVERENEKKWNKYVDILINPKATEGENVMFIVKEIKLFEGSTVTYGCNSLTPYLGVKSGRGDSYLLALNSKINKLEKALTSGTQSDDMMHSIELQCLQLKQLMKEMCAMLPLKEVKEKKDEPKPFDVEAFKKAFK